MARTTKKQLRATWLQVHKWIGLSLAMLIIPISLTGSALVWHDWLDAKLEPQRHARYGEANLAPSRYAEAAKRGDWSGAADFDASGSKEKGVRSSRPPPRS